MYLSFYNMMFFSTLVMGTLLSISSVTWFGAWTGLELNLISFIPLIIINNNQYSSEAALKYFLIQALGSAIIIFSASIVLLSVNMFSMLITSALLLKMGAAPFHFWLPYIMEGLLWPQLIILMTIQKLAPIFLITHLIHLKMSSIIIIMSSLLSSIIGAIMGMNQISLRKLMAFSSINHMAWMLVSLMISDSMLIFYFSFYCLISISVMLLFHFQQSYYFNHLMSYSKMSTELKVLISASLLSLGGLPPLTGFIPKWILIQELTTSNMFIMLMVLIPSALIMLYFYLRLSLSFLSLNSTKFKMLLKQANPQKFILTSLFFYFNLFTLIIPSLFILF
uniref:NADH-ubiquinone oxidoreductase chain 2 n=1 Tax=Pylocheles mortensenii TaxID=941203 RepID=A0A3Q8BD45_9EUCA|nr:NADH dehydrogenase subunit 2 [Pylocheles mortensenii]